jgi:hypothetical protein
MYGTGPFDHYGKSVPIKHDGSLIGRADLEALRDKLAKRLTEHRAISTRHMETGEYKNPVRKGYDIALTEVIDDIETALNADIIDRMIQGMK